MNACTRKRIAAATLLALAAAPALAQNGAGAEYARVTSAAPQYERVNTPREECWNEQVTGGGYPSAQGPQSYLGPVIGGVVGGLLGSQIGAGNGKKVAIGAGAIAGTLVGAHVAGSTAYAAAPQTVQRCRVVDQWENRLTGYDVAYQYAGRTYHALLPYDPGPRLQVRVSVEPVQ
jgi:uncharacterized protein YcfJ